MLTRSRRRLAALGLALAVPLLAACGFNAQTDQVYQPAVGPNDRNGRVDVLNAVVVTDSEGQGTFVASLVNKNPDDDVTLSTVTSSDQADQATVVKPVTVGPGSLVNLADTGAIAVSGDSIVPGGYVRLTLSFSNGATSQLNTPVVPRDQQFADVTLAETGSSSGTPSSSPSATPTS